MVITNLYNKSHGETEGTEIRKWHVENDETKSDGGIAYRFLITLRINALFIN